MKEMYKRMYIEKQFGMPDKALEPKPMRIIARARFASKREALAYVRNEAKRAQWAVQA